MKVVVFQAEAQKHVNDKPEQLVLSEGCAAAQRR